MPADFTKQVDTLATELTVADEIDTGAVSSPVTVLTPSSGMKIDTRAVYLATDSTSGKVAASYANTGELLGIIYCNKFAMIRLDSVRKVGQTDESIQISWTGTDTGAKIFYVIRYKETA